MAELLSAVARDSAGHSDLNAIFQEAVALAVSSLDLSLASTVEVIAYAVLTTLTPSLISNVLFVDRVDSSGYWAHLVRVDAAGSHDRCLNCNLSSLCGRGFPRGTWENANFIRVRAEGLLVFLNHSLAEHWTRFLNDLDNRDCNVSDWLVRFHNNLCVNFLTALCSRLSRKFILSVSIRAIGNRLRLWLGVPHLSILTLALIARSPGCIVHHAAVLRVSE